MIKNQTIKVFIIIAVLIFFLFGIFGIPQSFTPAGLLAAMQQRIHLGLDLKGGTHLILQVQVNDAINADSNRAVERLKDDLKSKNILYGEIVQPDQQNHPEIINVSGVSPQSIADFRSLVADRLPDYDLTSGANNSFTLIMRPSVVKDTKTKAQQQAIETIRNRIDQLGVSEPVIQDHGLGDYQILVQLPGVDDPARVKEIMQSTAMLEIKQVIGGPFSTQEQAMQSQPNGLLPPDSLLLPGTARAGGGDQGGESWYIVTRSSAITGRDLRGAQPSHDDNGQPAVGFTLTGEGGRKFYAFTSAHVKDRLGVVLDNKVQSVATIDEPIHDQGIIRGRFTQQEVQDQSMILRSGALPASIKYLEERTVGPSLGADSIRE